LTKRWGRFAERLVGDADPSGYTPWRDQAHLAAAPVGTTLPDGMADACRTVSALPAAHWSYLGASWLFAGYRHTVYIHVLTPNSSTPDC
jgi:hypothetical protein